MYVEALAKFVALVTKVECKKFLSFLLFPSTISMHMHTHTHARTHARTLTYMHTHTYIHTYICTLAYTHMSAHACMHAHTHTCTRTHKYTHWHTHTGSALEAWEWECLHGGEAIIKCTIKCHSAEKLGFDGDWREVATLPFCYKTSASQPNSHSSHQTEAHKQPLESSDKKFNIVFFGIKEPSSQTPRIDRQKHNLGKILNTLSYI